VNGICGCGSPACCCHPAIAGVFTYADLWGKLKTHLAPQALFAQSSPVHEPLLQAFPFPSTLREVTLHPLSQACVFVYSSHGRWVFLPLLWSFPPTTTFTRFPAPGCWVCATAPAFSGQFVYLQFCEGFPSSRFGAQGAPCSLLCVLFAIAYHSVSLFSLGRCQSVQRAMLIWPRDVCGSTMYHLAHLVVCILPSRLGTGIWWWCRSPAARISLLIFCLDGLSIGDGGY
jgi:hypothetical protein